MIKYLGSKRRLVPVLGALASRAEARTGADLFSGTTRVAQEWKRRGLEVWSLDLARYTEMLARAYIATDARDVDGAELEKTLSRLQHLPGRNGYVTATFSQAARYFQAENARRIDAIRDAVEEWRDHPWYPVLMTSLLEAADRVDSTTGVQMAYLKRWAPRSYQPLALRRPTLLAGPGHAWRGDTTELVDALPEVDVAYLDPPYNQHRYFTNYHVWETLVAWDAPAHYGVACKRIDARDPSTKSVFNDRRRSAAALADVIRRVRAGLVVVSASNEGWISLDDLIAMSECRGHVELLAFDSRRYVGALIGIHNPRGEKVGRVSHTQNTEYVVLAGERSLVQRVAAVNPEESTAAPASEGCRG